MSLICLENIIKVYGKEESKTVALNKVNIKIEKGEMVSIMGPSGSGKSTLLNILGCMDIPTSGEYFLDCKSTKNLDDTRLSEIRNTKVSFIFQNFALLDDYNVYDNIEMALNCRKMSERDKKIIIDKYMKKLGIEKLRKKKTNQISGGQQQRVAVARALVTEADIILADEPTGALDQKNGQELISTLRKLNKEGKTIIIVTHDGNVADKTDRIIRICDGRIIEDKKIK